jgi:quinol monooxygenase YgiN
MVIVAGHITVDPEQRESYLAGCISVVEKARRADGCLDFAVTADLLDPGRVNLFERWETLAAVETFRSNGPRKKQGAATRSVSVAEYDIADVRPLFEKAEQREGDRDHEADDNDVRLRRRSDAGDRSARRGPKRRIRARRLDHAALGRRGGGVTERDLSVRRRIPIWPTDLRDLRRLLGSGGRSAPEPHRRGVEHAAQVRGIDHAHRPAVGKHNRPLR